MVFDSCTWFPKTIEGGWFGCWVCSMVVTVDLGSLVIVDLGLVAARYGGNAVFQFLSVLTNELMDLIILVTRTTRM